MNELKTFYFGRENVKKGHLREYRLFPENYSIDSNEKMKIRAALSSQDPERNTREDAIIRQRIGEYDIRFQIPGEDSWVIGKGIMETLGGYYSYLVHGILLDEEQRKFLNYNDFLLSDQLNPYIGENREKSSNINWPKTLPICLKFPNYMLQSLKPEDQRWMALLTGEFVSGIMSGRQCAFDYNNGLDSTYWCQLFNLLPESDRKHIGIITFSGIYVGKPPAEVQILGHLKPNNWQRNTEKDKTLAISLKDLQKKYESREKNLGKFFYTCLKEAKENSVNNESAYFAKYEKMLKVLAKLTTKERSAAFHYISHTLWDFSLNSLEKYNKQLGSLHLYHWKKEHFKDVSEENRKNILGIRSSPNYRKSQQLNKLHYLLAFISDLLKQQKKEGERKYLKNFLNDISKEDLYEYLLWSGPNDEDKIRDRIKHFIWPGPDYIDIIIKVYSYIKNNTEGDIPLPPLHLNPALINKQKIMTIYLTDILQFISLKYDELFIKEQDQKELFIQTFWDRVIYYLNDVIGVLISERLGLYRKCFQDNIINMRSTDFFHKCIKELGMKEKGIKNNVIKILKEDKMLLDKQDDRNVRIKTHSELLGKYIAILRNNEE